MNFLNIKTLLAKISRKVKNLNEIDAIEDAMEALSYLSTPEMEVDKVVFKDVKNYSTELPNDFSQMIQVVKDTKSSTVKDSFCTTDQIEDTCLLDSDVCSCGDDICSCDGDGAPLISFDPLSNAIIMDYRLYVNVRDKVKGRFVPIRLSSAKFFGNNEIYKNGNREFGVQYEYKEVAGKRLLFSFKEGVVGISYRAILTDEEGIPLIPDLPEVVNAVSYYVLWQLAERNLWAGRDGYDRLTQYSDSKWQHYSAQAIAALKMPKNIDELQNIVDNYKHIIKGDDYNTIR